jgi:L-lactate dehydrogenase complex protein LldF
MANAIEQYAKNLSEVTREAVRKSGALTTGQRVEILHKDFDDPDEIRRLASKIKQHTIDHLDRYLEQAEASLVKSGAKVHFASDAESARQRVLDILQQNQVDRVVKSKSMATEEIHLNPFLEKHGIETVETDLGEFIIQIDEDTPSHIVRPIIHKKREEVAESFQRHGLGDYNTDPETITRRARVHLREKYMQSGAGITGGNFVSSESGRIVLVTNEGNARFSMAPNKVHIAVIGIEKVVPRDRDLAVFLNLLARSATAQQLTVYTQFIKGPRMPAQPSGPEQMHVVFLDNGRSQILGESCREILRCIRCGACQNVCPVYRHASGHAYRAVYGGPIGAVLSPLLGGKAAFPEYADLPKASSLCGACREVCPVDIPIPEMLLKLRHKAKKQNVPTPGAFPMAPYATLATSPAAWRTAMTAARAMNYLPMKLAPIKPLRDWLGDRTLPKWRGGEFRHWLKTRKGGSADV